MAMCAMFDIAGGVFGCRTLCVIAADKPLSTFGPSRTTWRDDMTNKEIKKMSDAELDKIIREFMLMASHPERMCKKSMRQVERTLDKLQEVQIERMGNRRAKYLAFNV